MISLKIINEKDRVQSVASGEKEVCLVHTAAYETGDYISVELSETPKWLWIRLDDALQGNLVYVTENFSLPIPMGQKRVSYSPKAFYGDRHYLYAREAREDEIHAYRNLALNPHDQASETVRCYPHAHANVETRGEAVFAARNAIDGVIANLAHGEWPYESWGINRREDAWMEVDFGVDVIVEKVVLYTRADFPHDNYWVNGILTFSDGERMELAMEKSVKPHEFMVPKKVTRSVRLENLIKSQEESPFPALTQLEVYGYVKGD
ncbi:MAG: carbohydrate-binding protein [Lachnospiraceae bacterium]|nr:carbohydrate-binding protein [Lachnospiraceae bacterium]